jgi:maleate isomerase
MSIAAGPATDDLIVDRTHMPYALDGGVGWRASVGLIVLSSDYTIEHEFRKMLDVPGLALYQSRIENDTEITPQTLALMEARIPRATAVITPGVKLDVVCYACTSGAMVIGEANVHARIREARPGVACTTPMEAAFAALRALGVRRVALIAPYVDAINRAMRAHMIAHGFQVPVLGSWNIPDDDTVARLSAATLRDAVLELGGHDAVDAAFVSCTSVRLVEQIDALEAALGKPVISSNQASAWHCLRLAGIQDAVAGCGRLFRTALTP